MNSLLDLRFVIGIFFLIVSILLLIYSFTIEGESASINLWCGIGLGVFGLVMLLLSFKKDESDKVLDHDQLKSN